MGFSGHMSRLPAHLHYVIWPAEVFTVQLGRRITMHPIATAPVLAVQNTAFKSGVVGTDGVVVSLMNAAGVPAGVGDTNRPNAMQQEQPVQLHSPFGRVHGEEAAIAAAAGRTAGSNAVSQAAVVKGASHSSSRNGSDGGSNGGSSRFDRWVAAGSSSNDAGNHTTAARSSSSSSHVKSSSQPALGHKTEQHQEQQRRQQRAPAVSVAAGAAGQGSSSRKAPSKLTCRLLLDCMGE